jgi:hypothetical protein
MRTARRTSDGRLVRRGRCALIATALGRAYFAVDLGLLAVDARHTAG